jgi:hypothetical protein
MLYLGAAISGVGAAVLALRSLPLIKNSTITVFGYALETITTYGGGILILLGLLVVVFSIVCKVYQGLCTIPIYPLLDYLHYQATPATEQELKSIYNMAYEFFEGDVSPLENMIAWQNHNPNIFWAIKKRNENEGKIVGYFCVIPLKRKAAKLIQKEEITGAQFELDHITSKKYKAKPYAIYIGAVAAKGLFARAASINHLDQFLRHLKMRKIINTYTRPVTKDGLRLAKKKGFKSVDNDNQNMMNRVCYLNLSTM